MTPATEIDIIFDKTTGDILGRGKCWWATNQGVRYLGYNAGFKSYQHGARVRDVSVDFTTVDARHSDVWVTIEYKPGMWKIIPASKLHPNQIWGDSINITKEQ